LFTQIISPYIYLGHCLNQTGHLQRWRTAVISIVKGRKNLNEGVKQIDCAQTDFALETFT